jgi:uncharacterized membrane protein YfcA
MSLVPAIPNPIFTVAGHEVSKATGLLVLFAVIMLAASYSMIRKQKKAAEADIDEVKYNYPLILSEGAIVGVVTGLVGAGGGFLIIPALVLLAKLPMKKAVGTSLMIIAAKSLIGFMGDLRGDEVIDWKFMLIFTAIAVVGIFTGSYMSSKISNDKLKPVFGWFVLVMGIYILLKETVFK